MFILYLFKLRLASAHIFVIYSVFKLANHLKITLY